MTDRYVVHWDGVTSDYQHCGNGNSPGPAASAGAEGAWNDVWDLLENLGPSSGDPIAAGNIIHIRALDSGDNALAATYAVAKTFGDDGGIVSAPVYWVLDDGTEWSGITGDLTITMSGNVSPTFRDYNEFFGATGQRNWKLIANSLSSGFIAVTNGTHLRDWYIEQISGGNGGRLYLTGKECVVEDSAMKWYQSNGSGALQITGHVKLINFDLELTNTSPTSTQCYALYPSGNGASLEWIGGKIHGDGATDGMYLMTIGANINPGLIHLQDVYFPTLMRMAYGTAYNSPRLLVDSADSLLGCGYVDEACQMDSRDDGNYPTLNATLPLTTGEKFSYKFWPSGNSVVGRAQMPMAVLWTQAAAQQTITVEFLIENSLTTPTNGNTWMVVTYIDNTSGERVYETTQVLGGTTTLDDGSDQWSATTYAELSFVPYKLSHTTAGSIKQNTVVDIFFVTTIRSITYQKVLFIDPDPVFSTP